MEESKFEDMHGGPTMARGTGFRITGGLLKGRLLTSPPTLKTRPMQGFLREAVFNILADRVAGASVLDLFSGTGSIGLEALSRGADRCAFFEAGREALRVLERNVRTLKMEQKSRIVPKDILRLKGLPETGFEPFDLLFLDPPFAYNDPPHRFDPSPLLTRLNLDGCLDPKAVLVNQLRKKQRPLEQVGPFSIQDFREYGSSCVAFYGWVADPRSSA